MPHPSVSLAIVKVCARGGDKFANEICRVIGKGGPTVQTMLRELPYKGYVERRKDKITGLFMYRTTQAGAIWALEQIKLEKARQQKNIST